MKRWIWLAVPVLVLSFILVDTIGSGKAGKESTPAPSFSLKDLNGKEISLSDYAGKVLYMNFWATWCPPCRAEIPDFISFYKEYKDRGLEVLGVSVDQMSPEKVLAFAKANGMNYPVVMYTMELINDYRPGNAIPTTIVIDRKGKIRHKQVGRMSKEMLIRIFQEISQPE
jgi:cytochrome c biogenesis protein CcmG/thiol:disulfide interchange protein DsbE